MQLDVARLALKPAGRLVHHYSRIGQCKSHAFISPAHNSRDPMDAAWPMHSVDTAGLMNCMVS